jgi:hypothetical protein
MSKKHYEAVAAMLKRRGLAEGASGARAVREVARELADLYAEDNPRFDRDRFLEAAGFVSLASTTRLLGESGVYSDEDDRRFHPEAYGEEA